MIDYELALKLKKEGFPQKGIIWGERESDVFILGLNKGNFKRHEIRKERLLFPTLAELIEACGDKLWKIEQINNQWYCFSKKDGVLMPGDDDIEESIAQFWLSLNEKNENNPSSDK